MVVTGASSGIGEGLARELAGAGAVLTLVARRRERLQELAREIAEAGGSAEPLAFDLGATGAGRRLGERLLAERPAVDELVNNAGTSGEMSDFVDKTAASVRQTFELNLLSPVELAHVILPGMIERRTGTLVSVASVSAWTPTPKSSTYVASKRALVAVDEVLRLELAGTGVHVVSVFPGPVLTPMLQKTLEDPLGANLKHLPTGTVEGMARRIRIAIEERRDVVVYPDAFRPLRWISGALGPITRVSQPLLDLLGKKS